MFSLSLTLTHKCCNTSISISLIKPAGCAGCYWAHLLSERAPTKGWWYAQRLEMELEITAFPTGGQQGVCGGVLRRRRDGANSGVFYVNERMSVRTAPPPPSSFGPPSLLAQQWNINKLIKHSDYMCTEQRLGLLKLHTHNCAQEVSRGV